jgi:hypothetical protein
MYEIYGRYRNLKPVDIEECPKKTDKLVWRRLNDQGKRYTILEARCDMNFSDLFQSVRELRQEVAELRLKLTETRNELSDLKRKVYGSST